MKTLIHKTVRRQVLVLVLNLAAFVGVSGEIHDAARTGDLKTVDQLTKARPSLVHLLNERFASPLHLAALGGHTMTVELLLRRGAPVNIRGAHDQTPLHSTASEGQLKVATLLLEHRADVDAAGVQGETPLHCCASEGQLAVAELLLNRGASVNVTDTQGWTPLHAAAQAGQVGLVKLLLARGANASLENASGKTAEALAVEKNHVEIVAWLRAGSPGQSTQREMAVAAPIGRVGAARQIIFEGAVTFSSEALLRGLQATPDFWRISHPHAPLPEFLAALEARLKSGYQYSGFPDANISVRLDEPRGVVVTVAEGPRYLCGPVRVTGAKKISPGPIRDALTTLRSTKTDEASHLFNPPPPTVRPLKESDLADFAATASTWIAGKPATFSHYAQEQWEKRVANVLHEQGFFFPQFETKVVTNATGHTAVLLVKIKDEGPRAVVGRIEIWGNRKNTRESMLRHLRIKPGMALTTGLATKLEAQLRDSARFIQHEVQIGQPDPKGKVLLHIVLMEYEGAPAWDKEFSRAQKTLLKTCAWLEQLHHRDEDIILSLAGAGEFASLALELALSAHRGIAWQFRHSDPPTNTSLTSVVAGTNLLGYYSASSRRQLLLPSPDATITAFLKLAANPPDEKGNIAWFNMGASIWSRSSDESNQPPFRFDLALTPVAFVVTANQVATNIQFGGGEMVMVIDDGFGKIRIEESTGRVNGLTYRHENPEAHFEVHFARGGHEKLVQQIKAGSSTFTNLYQADKPWSSAIAFFADEVVRSRLPGKFGLALGSSETLKHLPGLFSQLAAKNVFAPLEEIFSDNQEDTSATNNFLIPDFLRDSKTAQAGMLAVTAEFLISRSDRAFPAKGWPWTLMREAGFFCKGNAPYTEEALRAIFESEQTGPIGCWMTARLLRYINSPLAPRFATRGLERLSDEDFGRDCDGLLTPDSLTGGILSRIAEVLRDQNPVEFEVLARLQTPARANFLRAIRSAMQAASPRPIHQTLAPALREYWRAELRQLVAADLDALAVDADAAYQRGLQILQGNRSANDQLEAIKLFERANRDGHAGAQFQLGRIHEQGWGVALDFTEALKWYLLAARNGHSEAQLTIANFYAEGLNVEPDPIEALAWYGTAASQGDRLAETYRKSLQRKMTPEQIAAAEKRSLEIRKEIGQYQPARR